LGFAADEAKIQQLLRGCAAPAVIVHRSRRSTPTERRSPVSPQAVRPLALTAMAGGVLYVVSGVAQLASPGQTDPFSGTSDYLIQVLRALSLLLTLAGFVALHLLLQAGGYRGARGWTGFRAAILGQGAVLASAVGSLLAGAPALGFLSIAGTLVLLVGLALLSVATHRAALLPGWSAYLVGALAVGVLGEVGVVVAGVDWVVLAYVLLSKGHEMTGRPSRAS
jgi:hypothetical protein